MKFVFGEHLDGGRNLGLKIQKIAFFLFC